MPVIKRIMPQACSAQCFNRAIIDDHFRQLQENSVRKPFHGQMHTTWTKRVVSEKEVDKCKPSNISFLAIDGPRYKLHSANLELVTIIECVSTDGNSLLRCPARFHLPRERVSPSIGISENDEFLCEKWFLGMRAVRSTGTAVQLYGHVTGTVEPSTVRSLCFADP
jgi:hypothetical protein